MKKVNKIDQCIFTNDCTNVLNDSKAHLCCHFCTKSGKCEIACKAFSEKCKLLVDREYIDSIKIKSTWCEEKEKTPRKRK